MGVDDVDFLIDGERNLRLDEQAQTAERFVVDFDELRFIGRRIEHRKIGAAVFGEPRRAASFVAVVVSFQPGNHVSAPCRCSPLARDGARAAADFALARRSAALLFSTQS